jgi:hypothetical protein
LWTYTAVTQTLPKWTSISTSFRDKCKVINVVANSSFCSIHFEHLNLGQLHPNQSIGLSCLCFGFAQSISLILGPWTIYHNSFISHSFVAWSKSTALPENTYKGIALIRLRRTALEFKASFSKVMLSYTSSARCLYQQTT